MKQLNLISKVIIAFLLVATSYQTAKAQLSGTYTIGGTSPNYTTLNAAISALNSLGVNGPVQFLIRDGSYSGTTWIGSINNIAGASSTNTITFRSQSGNKANVVITDGSSGNYIFRFNNSRYIIVKDMTLVKSSTSYSRVFDFVSQSSYNTIENCVIQGPATTSSSNATALVYATGHTGTDNTFTGCNFINGGSWAYIYGSGTTSTSTNMVFANSTFTATNSGYYGFYTYYTSGLKFHDNTFNRTGSGVYYFHYSFYMNNDFEFIDNVVNVSTTSTLYGLYCYYMNYITNSSTMTPKIHNNNINFTNTTGSTYPFYTYYAYYATYLNNVVNTTVTSGYIYGYGPMYYNFNSKADGNTITYNTTPGSGYIYNYYMIYNGANSPDTFTNNKVTQNGMYQTNYVAYLGNTIITDNEFKYNTTTGSIYNYVYYPSGMLFARNKVIATSTGGTIVALYPYNTTSYAGGTFINNYIEATSTTGTVYGLQAYYLNGDKFYSNVVTTKTAGANYTLYAYLNYNSFFKNNTFHSNATGSTNYVAYIYNTSSSYKAELKNNIFSRTGTSGNMIYSYHKDYFKSDYNLYYTPGGSIFQNNSPAYTGSVLQTWRNTTGNDMNSLIYQPPYVNAAGNDFRIDASSPAAWAVNGRAEHDTVIKTDMSGANRPYLVPTGVPDLGAYEVSPTSTPPNADATPANPVANSTQVFTFGQDTVATIDWGADVPATYTMRQYTGVQAAPMPVGVGRMYFYAAGTPATWVHGHKPNIYYKDPWTGDIPGGENDAVVARSSNNGAWEGYNYTNASTDKVRNILKPTNTLDSVGSYTGVQNGRIGIRCVESPKGISVTNITAIAADINWQPVFNPIGYQVLIKTNTKYPTNAEWTASNKPTTNSLAAGGLTEDTKYYVFIRSICGAKDTSGFTMDSFTTLITCHTPVITISGLNGTRAVVSWQLVKTAHKYEYAMNKSATPPAVGTDINKNSMLAPFLDEGTEYYVHVRAHCSSIYNQSAWATAKFNTWAVNVNNVNGEGAQLAVYPNPVQQEMVVTIGGTVQEGTIAVMDMTGKLLKTQTVNSNTVTVNVTELPAGMYIVQYTDDSRREQVKFSKQ
jgi:hypothetical protein